MKIEDGLDSLTTARQLMKEASTYASGKLADLEERAHFLQELHDAQGNE